MSKPPKQYRDVVHVFCGWIIVGRDEDNQKALFLIDHRPDAATSGLGEALASRVYNLSGWGKNQVTVKYHITDKPFTDEELTMMVVASVFGEKTLGGLLSAEYFHRRAGSGIGRYGEMTGYLWTDETFKVGGHDIIAELRSDHGMWCHLILTIHEK